MDGHIWCFQKEWPQMLNLLIELFMYAKREKHLNMYELMR